jgi:hypothetical protein
MADFSTIKAIRASVADAHGLLDDYRAAYRACKRIQARVALYQAGTNTVFNATANATYDSAQRAELVAMLAQVNALVTNWETNHLSAVTET